MTTVLQDSLQSVGLCVGYRATISCYCAVFSRREQDQEHLLCLIAIGSAIVQAVLPEGVFQSGFLGVELEDPRRL